MEQVEMLWQFQQADMDADAMEGEIKRAPTRLALLKNREFLVEQQNIVKRMEEEVSEMVDRVDVIKDGINRLEEQLGALQRRLAEHTPTDLEQARELSLDAQKLLNGITSYEQEMKRIQKDAAERDRLEKDIRIRYAKVKAEYDKQKVAYESEYKEQIKILEGKRQHAQEKAKGIDAALLERYQVIKQHCVPAVARLVGDQCGGCNMSLPSVTLRNLKSGTKMIECETCGRMIIQM
ncbi:MAG: C4-type zinc ribbon domain-containing protein [Clostridia bacterium]|nr:C4-type zinc ribbon domain-containing protein [Clostridia bacterium]